MMWIHLQSTVFISFLWQQRNIYTSSWGSRSRISQRTAAFQWNAALLFKYESPGTCSARRHDLTIFTSTHDVSAWSSPSPGSPAGDELMLCFWWEQGSLGGWGCIQQSHIASFMCVWEKAYGGYYHCANFLWPGARFQLWIQKREKT